MRLHDYLRSRRRGALLFWITALGTGSAGLLLALVLCAAAPPSPNAVHGGLPRATTPEAAFRRLDNPGFTVGYSHRYGVPVWTVYRAAPIADPGPPGRADFDRDRRLPRTRDLAAYRGSGYDRGHMAPNYLIASLYGKAAQKASFLSSNIAPQSPRLNQLLWQRLEEIEADRLAVRADGLWVTVGPVYGDHPPRLGKGDGRILVPEAYYRIWLRLEDGRPRVLALRVPQDARGDERLDAFVTSVDRLEAETGLDFHPGLDDSVEAAVEAAAGSAQAWGLAELACFPARYRDDWQGRDGIRLNYDRCD